MIVYSPVLSLRPLLRPSMQTLFPKQPIILYSSTLGLSQLQHSSSPVSPLLVSTSNTRFRFSRHEPDTPPVDKLQREFDSLFLRFLEEDIPARILGEEHEGGGSQQITQKSEDINVQEDQADPIRTFFKSCTGLRFDSHQEGPVHRRLDCSSTWQIRQSGTKESNTNNETLAQTPDERVKPADVEADTETDEQDLLKSIINIAKNLPVNTKLADFLDPYIGKLGPRDCNSLLQILGEESLCLEALYLLEWMGLQEPSLVTPRTYSIVFPLLGKTGMADKLLVLFKNMPMGRAFHCVNVYNALISGLSRCGRYDDAWDALQEMERRNIEPDSVTCSTFITVMRKSGQNARDAWQFFEKMSKKGVRWSSEIFGSLIKSFCNEDLKKEALIIMSEMEKHGFHPNVIIYNTLIDAYGKSNQLEEAEGLFLEMKQRNLKPTVSTYNTLIDAYSKKGRHEVAEELIEEMGYSGLNPDVWTYTCLISAYGRQKTMSEKAVNAFFRMKKEGIVPNCHAYTALIYAYSVSGWHEKAYIAFENMIREGLKPSLETYTTLLDAYRRAGDTQKLMEIWKMMRRDGIEGTRVTFNILVDGFAKQGHYRDARDVVYEFGKIGLKPQVMTYNMLINAYARGGRHNKCPQILQEMKAANLKPDSYTYSTLIYAYFRVRDFKKAFHYHKEMIRSKQVPDSKSYAKMRAVLDLKLEMKNDRDRKAALGRIRKQMGLPNTAKRSKDFWKGGRRHENRVTT